MVPTAGWSASAYSGACNELNVSPSGKGTSPVISHRTLPWWRFSPWKSKTSISASWLRRITAGLGWTSIWRPFCTSWWCSWWCSWFTGGWWFWSASKGHEANNNTVNQAIFTILNSSKMGLATDSFCQQSNLIKPILSTLGTDRVGR